MYRILRIPEYGTTLAEQPVEIDVRPTPIRDSSVKIAMTRDKQAAKLQKLKHYVESLCGIYSRIARRLGVDRTYVSRVVKGERHSPEIEAALVQEFDRSQQNIQK
jgi:predicted XRE-type DNA-binding protein